MLIYIKISFFMGTWDVEAEGSWIQGHAQLQSKFKANHGNRRHSLTNKTEKLFSTEVPFLK